MCYECGYNSLIFAEQLARERAREQPVKAQQEKEPWKRLSTLTGATDRKRRERVTKCVLPASHQGLAHIPDLEDGRSLDVVPVLLGERIYGLLALPLLPL
jgi:hypothetical protein